MYCICIAVITRDKKSPMRDSSIYTHQLISLTTVKWFLPAPFVLCNRYKYFDALNASIRCPHDFMNKKSTSAFNFFRTPMFTTQKIAPASFFA